MRILLKVPILSIAMPFRTMPLSSLTLLEDMFTINPMEKSLPNINAHINIGFSIRSSVNISVSSIVFVYL